MKKNIKQLVALTAVVAASSAFAADNTGAMHADQSDSFGQLLNIMIGWMQGNLGKMLALLGFIGTFVVYLMTHKGSVLFVGIIMSLIAGGLVGIVTTFFEAGNSAFTAISASS